MTWRKAALISALLVAAMFVAGLVAWLHLPAGAQVAKHFDALGRPNGWGPASRVFFILPLVALPPSEPAPRLTLPVVLVIAGACVLKSYLVWRELGKPPLK